MDIGFHEPHEVVLQKGMKMVMQWISWPCSMNAVGLSLSYPVIAPDFSILSTHSTLILNVKHTNLRPVEKQQNIKNKIKEIFLCQTS